MVAVSSSLKMIKYDDLRKTLMPHRKSAYNTAAKFFDQMKDFDVLKFEK